MDDLNTLGDFVNAVFNSDLAVVDFWAEWCNPCKNLEPILEELEGKYKHIKFFKVNVETAPAVAEHCSVQGLPTLAVFKRGNLMGRQVGLPGKKEDIEKILAKAF